MEGSKCFNNITNEGSKSKLAETLIREFIASHKEPVSLLDILVYASTNDAFRDIPPGIAGKVAWQVTHDDKTEPEPIAEPNDASSTDNTDTSLDNSLSDAPIKKQQLKALNDWAGIN